jgi:hypothetical protein
MSLPYYFGSSGTCSRLAKGREININVTMNCSEGGKFTVSQRNELTEEKGCF